MVDFFSQITGSTSSCLPFDVRIWLRFVAVGRNGIPAYFLVGRNTIPAYLLAGRNTIPAYFLAGRNTIPAYFCSHKVQHSPFILSSPTMRFCLFFIFTTLSFFQNAVAQHSMFQRLSFPVYQDGKAIRFPFAGGINAAQLSAADLNQDGVEDLVVFDRTGDVLLTFLNGGQPNEVDYDFAPEYACNFPLMRDYVLVRDFNGDGAADIFTSSITPGAQEVAVFQGYFEKKQLKFKPFRFTYPNCPTCDPFQIYYPDEMQGKWNNLSIGKVDYPAVDDIDGDGDLDILAFTTSSTAHTWFFRNLSIESGFGKDSLHFKLEDNCWGRFYSGMTCKNSLSPSPDFCQPNLMGGAEDRDGESNRHAGSTVMTYDQDGDGDKEIVLSGISFTCLDQLVNGGTPSSAWMNGQDDNFPSYDVPVNMAVFPASFYLDVNNDNKKDLFVAPNVKTIGEDQDCLWWYKNTAATGHRFELETKSLLSSDMIDLGTASHPAVADVNGDGLLDIVVGSYGFYQNQQATNARLYLYLNVGTANAPQFSLSDRNWLNMAEFTPDDFDFAPTFGDIDGDGDLDLIVGSNLGWLYCYRNDGGPGTPMVLQRDFDLMWQLILIGVSSTPIIFDLDGDGLNDIIAGARKGNISWLKNVGPSVTEPRFEVSPTYKNLGGINTVQPGNSFGWSAPALAATTAGNVLVTGTTDGNLMAFNGLSASPGAVFTKIDNAFGNIAEGYRSHPTFADIDADGTLDMIVGNQRGGISIFKTEMQACPTSSSTVAAAPTNPLRILPNPASNWVRAELPGNAPAHWRATDALGREMAAGEVPAGILNIQVASWPAGVYILETVSAGIKAVGKLIVKR